MCSGNREEAGVAEAWISGREGEGDKTMKLGRGQLAEAPQCMTELLGILAVVGSHYMTPKGS